MWIARTGVLSSSGGGLIPVNTSGLLFYLDSSIPSSYSGSGTTWTDVVTGAYNGTLVNGVTYSASNGGSLVLDGVNDYINIATIFTPGTSNFSLGTWVKLSSSQITLTGLFGKLRSGSSQGRLGMYYNSSSTKVQSILEFAGATVSLIASTTSINNNNWYYLMQTVNRAGNQTLYVNGVAQSSINISAYSAQNLNWAVPLRMGTYPNATDVPSNFMNGSIANGHVYTRELSAAEVLANFNATKSKYGL